MKAACMTASLNLQACCCCRGAVGGLSAHERMRDLLKDVLDALNKRVPRQKRFIFTVRTCVTISMYIGDFLNSYSAEKTCIGSCLCLHIGT